MDKGDTKEEGSPKELVNNEILIVKDLHTDQNKTFLPLQAKD